MVRNSGQLGVYGLHWRPVKDCPVSLFRSAADYTPHSGKPFHGTDCAFGSAFSGRAPRSTIDPMSQQVELVVDAAASLGEGPCWDDRENVLWWVDILQQTLYRYDPNTGMSRSFQFDRSISVAIPRSAGGLVVALRDGFYAFDP